MRCSPRRDRENPIVWLQQLTACPRYGGGLGRGQNFGTLKKGPRELKFGPHRHDTDSDGLPEAEPSWTNQSREKFWSKNTLAILSSFLEEYNRMEDYCFFAGQS